MICQNCEEGIVPGQARYASRDMAIDAGDPSLEGVFVEHDKETCPCCNGDFTECQNCTEAVAISPESL